MKKILENIKSIRKELGYSQEFMADKLGITQVGYNKIEIGGRNLKYKTLEQIAIIFKMPIANVIEYPDIWIKKNEKAKPNRRVTLQIDIEEEDIKADVIKLAFGQRVLEIKNVKL